MQPLATVIAHGAVPALAGAQDGHRKARLVYRAGAAVAIATSLVVLTATPLMLPLIFGAEFRSALPAALVLVIASGITSLNSVGAECLRGLGRPRSVLRAECVGLAVTAIALPALIPLAGIVGAACASVLAYSATLIVQRRQLRTPGENAVIDVTAGVRQPGPGRITMISHGTALEPATVPATASQATLPNAFGLATAALIVAGLFLVVAAFRVNGLGFENSALWLYSLGLTYIGVLTFWESTRLRVGALPSWTSPPALIAGWALAWICARPRPVLRRVSARQLQLHREVRRCS